MNKTQTTAMQKEVSAFLRTLGAKYNLDLRKNNARYSDDGIRLSLELVHKGAKSAVERTKAANLQYYLVSHNLNPTGEYQGQVAELTGYNTRSRRAPFEFRCGGKSYRCNLGTATGIFGKTKKAV